MGKRDGWLCGETQDSGARHGPAGLIPQSRSFHTPVLLCEVLDLLALKPGAVSVDATVGGGGHSEGMLQRVLPGGLVIGIDRDPEALSAAASRLWGYGSAFVPVKENMSNIGAVLDRLRLERVDAILADLGVSSHQLECARRGFSFRHDGPLDMRMDPELPVTAADIVNGYSEDELASLFSTYGEERYAKRIAASIAKRRKLAPIARTGELARLVEDAIPAAARYSSNVHPATRVFQALRIAVNHELGELEAFLRTALDRLKPGGRLCVISYHSLEDRLVKSAFRDAAKECTCPPRLPVCVCGRQPKARVITRRAVVPSDEEKRLNPRSRSARLRCVERL
ncbi:MAG: 16S rRNA (cytosine(1402)-N(4))-methyltransferase RsmH [Armatimonadota bacterium]